MNALSGPDRRTYISIRDSKRKSPSTHVTCYGLTPRQAASIVRRALAEETRVRLLRAEAVRQAALMAPAETRVTSELPGDGETRGGGAA